MEQNEIYTQVDEIQDAIGMSDEDAERMKEIVAEYPMAVTDYYLSLIDPADAKDPIRKMCIPSLEEFSDEGESDTSGQYGDAGRTAQVSFHGADTGDQQMRDVLQTLFPKTHGRRDGSGDKQ